MSHKQEPLSADQMAEELRLFTEAKRGMSASRSVCDYLHSDQQKTVTTIDNFDVPREILNPDIHDLETGKMFKWLCSRCGHKLTNNQIGKMFASSVYQKYKRRMAACGLCQGVAYYLDDEQRIKDEEGREVAKKIQQRKNSIVSMTGSTLFFLALPVFISFLVLVVMTIFVGPLSWLEPRSKMSALILTCLCTSLPIWLGGCFFVPDSWPLGYMVFIPGYLCVILITLLISCFSRTMGEGVGNIIYRR